MIRESVQCPVMSIPVVNRVSNANPNKSCHQFSEETLIKKELTTKTLDYQIQHHSTVLLIPSRCRFPQQCPSNYYRFSASYYPFAKVGNRECICHYPMATNSGQMLPSSGMGPSPSLQVKITALPVPVNTAQHLPVITFTVIGRAPTERVFCVSEVILDSLDGKRQKHSLRFQAPVSQLRFVCVDCVQRNITDMSASSSSFLFNPLPTFRLEFLNAAQDLTHVTTFPVSCLHNFAQNHWHMAGSFPQKSELFWWQFAFSSASPVSPIHSSLGGKRKSSRPFTQTPQLPIPTHPICGLAAREAITHKPCYGRGQSPHRPMARQNDPSGLSTGDYGWVPPHRARPAGAGQFKTACASSFVHIPRGMTSSNKKQYKSNK